MSPNKLTVTVGRDGPKMLHNERTDTHIQNLLGMLGASLCMGAEKDLILVST